jgi:aminopeptidase N
VRRILSGVVILLAGLAAAPTAHAATFSPGARTGGDALFPQIGNGGYDAQHYALNLRYAVSSMVLRGTATMTAVATQDLSQFSMDLQHLGVTRVTVDGVRARFTQPRDDTKVIVTPATGIPAGTAFTVVTRYGGTEQPVIDPDGSREGWVADPTRGAVVVAEPIGAQGWFPDNNVPSDKASFEVTMTVPDGWDVLGSGALVSQHRRGGLATYHWSEKHPIPTYLASVAIGHYDRSASELDRAVPEVNAVDTTFDRREAIGVRLRQVAQMIGFYASWYGVGYPWETMGGIVPRQSVGYSLETVTKPTYAITTKQDTRGPSLATISHENAHMWFGDLVTLGQWKDIWLNEGMTEFSSWIWQERFDQGTPTPDLFADLYAHNRGHPKFWSIPPAAPPTAADIFDSDAMYDRGAMVMEAIREIAGEPVFLAIQHTWLTQHAFANVTTEQYIALVESMTDKPAARWVEFFRQWLYTPGKPTMTPANFDTYPV